MKHLSKPVRQCLFTAVATSTLLETTVLPLVAAAAAEQPPPSSSTEAAHPQENVAPAVPQPSAAPQVIASPELSSAAQTYTKIADIAVPQLTESSPAPAPPAPAEPAAAEQSAPASSTSASAAPAAAPAAADSAATSNAAADSTAASNTAVGEPAAPASSANPAAASAQEPAVAPANSVAFPSAPASAIDTAKQRLDKRLSDLVARDKSTREAQLRDNLVTTALHYAQAGDFDRARQIAQHPVLPPDLQADTLDKIAVIESQKTGKPIAAIRRSVAKAAGQPALTAAVPSSAADPGYTVAPSAPERISHFLSKRCLSQTMLPPASPPVSTAQPAAQPRPKSTATIISQLSQQAAMNLLSFANRPAAVAPQPIATQAVQGKQPPAQPSIATQPSAMPIALDIQAIHPIDAPAPEAKAVPTASQLSLKQMVRSTLSEPFGKVGLSLPIAIPAVFRSMMADWMDLTNGNFAVQKVEAIDASFAASTPTPAQSSDRASTDVFGLSFAATQQLAELSAHLPTQLPKITVPATKRTVVQPSEPAPVGEAVDFKQVLNINCAEFQDGIQPATYRIDPALSQQEGWKSMMFPLPIPAVITSLFGWRTHPIFGDRRFHAGVDLGAPTGTPVLAAMAGRVVAADYMGGYGLAVVIETAAGGIRNLYGHMSAVAVQPGTWVKKGSVLGLVGSTGNATGPHLHFETQVLQDGAWTAIDPLAAAAVAIAQSKSP